jgi:hypothetical protein
MGLPLRSLFVANSRTFVKLFLGSNLMQEPTVRPEALPGDQFSRQIPDYE